jgi:hypothetical protein
MTILRPAHVFTLCLGLTSACAARGPLSGPDPAAVRTTIAAQIAQSARTIRADTVVASLRHWDASRQ